MLLLLLLLSLGSQGSEASDSAPLCRPVLRGISLESRERAVVAALGPPTKRTESPWDQDRDHYRHVRLDYSGLVLVLDAWNDEPAIYAITVTSPSWRFSNGLAVGLRYQDVLEIVGTPSQEEPTADGGSLRLIYGNPPPEEIEMAEQLRIYLQGCVVIRIELWTDRNGC